MQVLDRMDEDTGEPSWRDLRELVTVRWADIDETIGYKREEWIIPVGQQLFVQGEVTDEDGHLRLRKPEKGPFRVSTRSEQELLAVEHASRPQVGRPSARARWPSSALVLVVVGLRWPSCGAAGR